MSSLIVRIFICAGPIDKRGMAMVTYPPFTVWTQQHWNPSRMLFTLRPLVAEFMHIGHLLILNHQKAHRLTFQMNLLS